MNSSARAPATIAGLNGTLGGAVGLLLLAGLAGTWMVFPRDEVARPSLSAVPVMVEAPAPSPALSPVFSAADPIFAAELAMSPDQLIRRWDPLVAVASRRFGVPQSWIRAVMRTESGGRTRLAENEPITSDAGAMGIMQVMPQTYEEMRTQYRLGSDPYDPRDNVFAGAAYLRFLRAKYGFPAMFAAYNDGPGNLEAHLFHGRPLPAETHAYLASVTGALGMRGVADTFDRAQFTRPNGTMLALDRNQIDGVRAAFPGEYPDSVQSVITAGKQRYGVRESLAAVTAMLGPRAKPG